MEEAYNLSRTALQLIENTRFFLKEKRYYWVSQHLQVLLNGIESTLFEPESIKQIFALTAVCAPSLPLAFSRIYLKKAIALAQQAHLNESIVLLQSAQAQLKVQKESVSFSAISASPLPEEKDIKLSRKVNFYLRQPDIMQLYLEWAAHPLCDTKVRPRLLSWINQTLEDALTLKSATAALPAEYVNRGCEIIERAIYLAEDYKLNTLKMKLSITQAKALEALQQEGENIAQGQKINVLLHADINMNNHKQVIRALNNYHQALQLAEYQQDATLIQQNTLAISQLEIRYLFQITWNFICQRLARAAVSGQLQRLEKVWKKVKNVGEQLMAYYQWEQAWRFFSHTLVLTKTFPLFSTMMLQTLGTISQALIASPQSTQQQEGAWQKARQQLKSYRQILLEKTQKSPEEYHHTEYSRQSITLVKSFVEDSMYYLGKAPDEYCLLGLGSMSSGSMSPYSDLECVMLFRHRESTRWDEPYEKNYRAEYFEALYRLLEFKMANLGEYNGFHLDEQVNAWAEELRGTPATIIQHFERSRKLTPCDEKWYALLNPVYIAGNDKSALLDNERIGFTALREAALNQDIDAHHTLWREKLLQDFTRIHRGLMEDAIKALSADFSHDILQKEGFDIKVNFVKPLTFWLMDVCLSLKMPYTHLNDVLGKLKTQKKLSPHIAFLFEKTLRWVSHIRTRVHLYYNRQEEIIWLKDQHSGQADELTNEEQRFLLKLPTVFYPSLIFTLAQAVHKKETSCFFDPPQAMCEALFNKGNEEESANTVITEEKKNALKNLVTILVMSEADLLTYRKSLLSLPSAGRKYFQQYIEEIASEFPTEKYAAIQSLLMHLPLPDGTRKSTTSSHAVYQAHFHCLTQAVSFPKTGLKKFFSMTWVNETGQLVTHALHPAVINYLKEKNYIDKTGQLLMTIEQLTALAGRHLVIPVNVEIEHQHLAFHLKFFPEMPLMEEAVCLFAHRVVGEGVPWVKLVRLTLGEKEYPVLISQSIAGEMLDYWLDDDKKAQQLLQNLDAESFSKRVLLSLLLNQEDAKPSNFIVTSAATADKQVRYRLVCIDNDRSFYPALTEEEKTILPVVKDITYCFEAMHHAIHPAVHADFLRLNPYQLLTAWLAELQTITLHAKILFSEEERHKFFPQADRITALKKDAKSWWLGREVIKKSVLALTFRPHTLATLYYKITRLQTLLHRHPHATHQQLLAKAEPYLAKYYQRLLGSKPSIVNRFLDGFRLLYGEMPNRKEALQTKKTPFMSLDTLHGRPVKAKEVLKEEQTQIEDMRRELQEVHHVQISQKALIKALHAEKLTAVEQLKAMRDPFLQENVINALDFSAIKEAHFQTLLVETILALALPYRVLKLNYWPLTDKQLETLLKPAKELQVLVLDRVKGLSPQCINIITLCCPVLEKLTLNGLDIKSLDSRQLLLPDLFTPVGILPPLSFSELISLQIQQCPQLTEVYIEASQLRRFEATYCCQLITGVVKSPFLNQINIMGCGGLTASQIKTLLPYQNTIDKISLAAQIAVPVSEFQAYLDWIIQKDTHNITSPYLIALFLDALSQAAVKQVNLDKPINQIMSFLYYSYQKLVKLLEDPSTAVKHVALFTLSRGEKADQKLMQVLKMQSEKGSYLSNKQVSAISLIRLGVQENAYFKLLKKALESPEKYIRTEAHAVWKFLNFDAKYLNQVVIKMLQDKNESRQREALKLIKQFKLLDMAVLQATLQSMSNSSEIYLKKTLNTLIQLSENEEKIFSLLKEKWVSLELRRGIVKSLIQLQYAHNPRLQQWVKHIDDLILIEELEAIISQPAREYLDGLILDLQSEEWSKREKAAQSLSEEEIMRKEAGFDLRKKAFKLALQDKHPKVRLAAIRAFSQHRDLLPSFIKTLISLLGDASADIRAQTLSLLNKAAGEIGAFKTDFLPIMGKLLHDKQHPIRCQAVNLLSRFIDFNDVDNKSVIEMINKALEDSFNDVRMAAINLLDKLCQPLTIRRFLEKSLHAEKLSLYSLQPQSKLPFFAFTPPDQPSVFSGEAYLGANTILPASVPFKKE